jgi:predicted nucleotidyltransferase
MNVLQPAPQRSLRKNDHEIGGNDMSKNNLIQEQIQEMVNRIVARFNPEKIILFGSHARGNAAADSDVDLLVIMSVSGSKREKMIEIGLALHDIPLPKDIIVTSPDEFEWRKEVPGTIERPAAKEGRLLYARV